MNTRSSSGANPLKRKSETLRQNQQQQQQTMTHVTNFGTPKRNSQLNNQNQQPPMQSLSPKPLVETNMPTTLVPPSSTVQDYQNNSVKPEEKISVTEKSDVRWPAKRKINKKEQKKRLNARMRRLVSPKSPLMVFSELFKDVPIQLQEHPIANGMSYIATLEIDGQLYTGNHASKTQAKQKACENFLRIMLTKKIRERSEKKEEPSNDTDMEDAENVIVQKSKGPPQEDFPWPHFASLAMHNLINQWELKAVSKASSSQEESNFVKSPPKAGAMRKFPDNPGKCNPVQLMYQMKPGLQFIDATLSLNTPSLFQTTCKIDEIPFSGQGTTKKAAKKECCIAAIKYFWKYDYHAEDNEFTKKI